MKAEARGKAGERGTELQSSADVPSPRELPASAAYRAASLRHDHTSELNADCVFFRVPLHTPRACLTQPIGPGCPPVCATRPPTHGRLLEGVGEPAGQWKLSGGVLMRTAISQGWLLLTPREAGSPLLEAPSLGFTKHRL